MCCFRCYYYGISMNNCFYKTIFSSLLLLTTLTSCDKISSYSKKVFYSERIKEPEEIKVIGTETPTKAPSSKPQRLEPAQLTSPQTKESSATIFYIRGNNVQIYPDKKIKTTYHLVMKGIGTTALYMQGSNESTGIISITRFEEKLKKPSLPATLVILKNNAEKIQKDESLMIQLSNPLFDLENQTFAFTFTMNEDLKSKYFSQSIGSVILFFQTL